MLCSAFPASSARFDPRTTSLGALFHRDDGVVGVALDALHEAGDLLRRLGHALGERANLVGDLGEATPVFAAHRRLDRRVEREQVRLVGDVLDEADDLADLLRALAQPLDLLRRLLHVVADVPHTLDALDPRPVCQTARRVTPRVRPPPLRARCSPRAARNRRGAPRRLRSG